MQKQIEVELPDIIEQYESIIDNHFQHYITTYLQSFSHDKVYEQLVRDTLETEINRKSHKIEKYMKSYLFSESEQKMMYSHSDLPKYESEHLKAKIQQINQEVAHQTNYIKTDLINKDLQEYALKYQSRLQDHNQKAQQQKSKLLEIRDKIINYAGINHDLKIKKQLHQQYKK